MSENVIEEVVVPAKKGVNKMLLAIIVAAVVIIVLAVMIITSKRETNDYRESYEETKAQHDTLTEEFTKQQHEYSDLLGEHNVLRKDLASARQDLNTYGIENDKEVNQCRMTAVQPVPTEGISINADINALAPVAPSAAINIPQLQKITPNIT